MSNEHVHPTFRKILELHGVDPQAALQAQIREMRMALDRMCLVFEHIEAETEGAYPPPDVGCIECTVGTVPDDRNTGLCAYHNAKHILVELSSP